MFPGDRWKKTPVFRQLPTMNKNSPIRLQVTVDRSSPDAKDSKTSFHRMIAHAVPVQSQKEWFNLPPVTVRSPSNQNRNGFASCQDDQNFIPPCQRDSRTNPSVSAHRTILVASPIPVAGVANRQLPSMTETSTRDSPCVRRSSHGKFSFRFAIYFYLCAALKSTPYYVPCIQISKIVPKCFSNIHVSSLSSP